MGDRLGDLAAQDSYDDPNAIDWSRMNQPFGVLKDTNPIEYGTASPLVNIRTQDIADATDKAMAFSGGGLGIKAYHGSPHDFSAFDMSKIGTGEGAQAYGHGLYFADSEGVAKSYRDALSQNIGNTQTAGGAADRFVSLYGDDAANAIKREIATMQNQAQKLRDAGKGVPQVFLDRIKNEYEPALELVNKGYKPGGRMYEVNINADPAHFLDWDKPLSGEAAQKASEALKTAGIDKTLADYIVANKTGKDVYTTLANKKYDTRVMPSDAGAVPASDIMREAGIPGIKYLDQGSRGAGQGSSNYVVFNDKLIDILRKYGIAGLPAGAAGMGALAASDNYQPGGM